MQRSVEDPSLLVATYEGEHIHIQPSPAELSFGSSSQCANQLGSVRLISSMRSSRPIATLDLIQTGLSESHKKSCIQGVERPAFQQLLLQQMASSLTSDPKFTTALATAISARINLDSSTLN